jgi:hypothetical protein
MHWTRETRWVLLTAALVVGLSCLPYAYAYLTTPPDLRFTGLLFNPQDGNSYYAKMLQGARGEWLFHLPFTSEPHEGAFIFTYYLALGHLARLTGLSIPLIYHLARAVNGFLCLLAAYGFVTLVTAKVSERRLIFLVVATSSGLGWLIGLLGYMTVDLWVPEAVTFYAILANPHFSLAMALMPVIFGLGAAGWGRERFPGWARGTLAGGAALLLAVVQPFCLVTVYAVLVVNLAILAARRRRWPWAEIGVAAAVVVASAPFLLYDAWVYMVNPALRAWSAQNLTPSPPPWDYALSYGVMLLLALVGGVWALRRGRDVDLLLVVWVGADLILLYLPIPLQRRLVLGLHLPLAILASLGLSRSILPRLRAGRKALTAGILGFSALTNVFLLLGASLAAAQHDPRLYLSADEGRALAWMRDHLPPDAVVLAAPQTGLFIPAWAGQRVVYGHQFETINAEKKKAQVEAFFRGTDDALLHDYGVSYVFVGPRERTLGNGAPPDDWQIAFACDGVAVYQSPLAHRLTSTTSLTVKPVPWVLQRSRARQEVRP